MPSLGSIVIYTKHMQEMIDFYSRHFGYAVIREPADRITELSPPKTGLTILLHQAARSQKQGQVMVKLVFDVHNVEEFCQQTASQGLEFGAIHKADGYVFANAKDPSGNSISVSSRAFRQG